MAPKCGNIACLGGETPLWRKGWVPAGASEATPLCNACGLLYKRGWFCSWCATVYRKREEEDDNALGAAPGAKLWVGCDRCDGWSHLSCELANDPACLGTGREVPFRETAALLETSAQLHDSAQFRDSTQHEKTTIRRTYHCPSCRKNERDSGERDKNASVNDSDRDSSWASSPLSRAAGATLAAGVVAHFRPYLRERDNALSRKADPHGAEPRGSRKRGRDKLCATSFQADVLNSAPRAKRARLEPKEKTAPKPAERKNPPKPKPKPEAPKPRLSAPRLEPETPLEELTFQREDSIAACVLGSAFGSVENKVFRGVPKAARTLKGRPRAARAEAAAEALGAAEREPKTAAATNRTAADDDEKANATDTADADETASPTDAPEAPEVAAAPAPAAQTAPASPPEADSPPAAQPSPLRGGMGSPRGLRLLRPSAQGAAPFPAGGRGSVSRAPAPPDPNAGTLNAINAFVAGGVRPGGSMLVRLLADSLLSGSRSASSSEAVASRANARETLPARLPARSSSSKLAVGLSGSGPRRDGGNGHLCPLRVGGVVVSAPRKNESAEKKRRVRAPSARTFSFGFEDRAGLEPASGGRLDEEDILLDDADADPWGLGLKQEWSDGIDWGDSV